MENSGGNQLSIVGSIAPKTWLIIIGVPVIGLAMYFGYRAIGRKFGLLDTPEDKMLKEIADLVEKQPFWSKTYYLTKNKGVKPLTETRSNYYATNIEEAGGWVFGGFTDESKINGAFEDIGSKAGISQVAEKFYSKYQKDLYTYLKEELDAEELAKIGQIISKYK